MYKALFTLLLLLYSVAPSFGQWKKIWQFDKDIQTIYFQDSTQNPDIGFVTTSKNFFDTEASLWRTSDGGNTWELAIAHSQLSGIIRDFTFKDSLIGWFAIAPFGMISSACYSTNDGGKNWYSINILGRGWGVFYNKFNNTLQLSEEINSMISFDEGNAWVQYSNLPCSIGFSYSSGLNGITSNCNASILYTEDGGITWKTGTGSTYECYQPITFPNSLICFALSEILDVLFISRDAGKTWQRRFDFQTGGEVMSGCIRGASNRLLIQSSNNALYSLDSGLTWISICGPSNVYDTRFCVKHDSIFMGDKYGGLWLNTTGIGSNSTPQITATTLSFGSSCDAQDTVIRFTYFDSCSGTQAKLVSASISGSNNFSLLAPFDNPRTIHTDDSLVVHYAPHNTNDTAQLGLKFHLGFIDVDTNINLTAAASANQNSTPQITATAVSFGASCDPRDTVIRFTYFDSCSGTQAKLVSASLSGSNNFSLLAPYNAPRTIHPDDSLVVHYTPTATQDTAKLHLRFHLGFIVVDTTIILLGSASLFQNVAFAMPRKDIFVTSGDVFSVSLYPSKSLTNIGLQRIDFDLEYYGDLVQYLDLTRQNNNSYTTIGQVTRNGKMETMPVSIVGADITLDSTQPIFSINFQAMVTDTNASPLRFKNFRLNNDDPKFKQCNLSYTITDGTIQELPACTDNIISIYLKYRRVPIELFSITPNPTAGNVTITFGASGDQPITIQILDVLGHLISERTITKVSPTNQEAFLLNQVSGVLYARISSGSEVVTGKFVKQ